ncbi:hypothetical protein ACFL2V_09340 [Pseudomonadota bacterium]
METLGAEVLLDISQIDMSTLERASIQALSKHITADTLSMPIDLIMEEVKTGTRVTGELVRKVHHLLNFPESIPRLESSQAVKNILLYLEQESALTPENIAEVIIEIRDGEAL